MLDGGRLRATMGLGLVALVISISTLGCGARGTAPPAVERTSEFPVRREPARDTLRVATVNMWGVSVLGFDWSDHIDERFAALARLVGGNEFDLDVVLVQEAWKHSARRALLDDPDVRIEFPYRVDAVERPGGSGLVILSAYPIDRALFSRFENQGNCWKFWEGDCLAGKGVLAAMIRIGDVTTWIANTHLIACYAESGEPKTSCDEMDDNGAARAAQVTDLRAFLDPLSKEAPVIVGGDFNFTRTSRYYREMSSEVESPSGTRTTRWREPGDRVFDRNRIDYVWSLPGAGASWRAVSPIERIMTAEVDVSSGVYVPLSDHQALVSEFCLVDDEPDSEYSCRRLRP